MVRPVTSKRKLFNTNKEQSKENEPDRLNSTSDANYSVCGSPLTHGVYQVQKSLNHPTEPKLEKNGNYSSVHSRRCDFDDAGPTLTPGRTAMPMSERQQIALLMQMSSPSPTNKSDLSLPSPCTPNTPHFSRGISKRNERGETPLHLAAIKGDPQKVSQLVDQGANVNATDYAGWTALHEACNKGFIIVASILIKAGADVNAKGLENDTPLHDACVNNHHKIVRLLLQSGAKTDALNQRGKSARDVCRSPRILSLIEQADAGVLGTLDSSEFASYTYNSQDIPLDNSYYTQYHLSTMSRRTPPSSKAEEKTTAPVLVATSTSSSSQSNTSTTSSSNVGSNGRPGSPRVTPLRLPAVQRTPEKSSKSSTSGDTEDVYEFRCSKEEGKTEVKEEKPEASRTSDASSSSGSSSSTNEPKTEKRPRDGEQEEDEETKKKRRKEENSKGTNRVTTSRPTISDKTSKGGSRSGSGNGATSKPPSSNPISANSSVATTTTASVTPVTSASTVSTSSSSSTLPPNTTTERKSPNASAPSSPKPKNDSDGEDVKSESNSGAPKVPPLKIVLAPFSLSEQETSSQNGNNRQLPYVVNSGGDKESSNGDSKENPVKEEPISPTSTTAPVVTTTTSTSSLITSVPSPTTSTVTSSTSAQVMTSNSTSTTSSSCESSISCSTTVTSSTSSTSSEKASAARITRSQRGGGGPGSDDGTSVDKIKVEIKEEEPVTSMATEVLHPRKRKLKLKEPEVEPPPALPPMDQPVTNCYEMFLKIRKQVDRRRKLLFPVQPKPPQGFKDYLMNRCSYVLANSNNSQLSIPIMPAPKSLAPPIEELFNEQEQERHKLKVQQIIEKEKLVLSVEQEILRVHGRAARALANQVLPFSVCTILKDEEVYNVISAEQEEKDRNARSRYNGRLFLSWLQDVDDKWEKIKEDMVLRHHNEAEALNAVQKMDWEWKQKELCLVEPSTTPQIDEQHVPMVQVADFDLLQPNNTC